MKKIRVIEPVKVEAKIKKRVCAYARVSTDSEEQEDSLVNQTKYYENYIESNPDWEYVGIYSDQGISGFKERRPGFQEMIADARKGKIDLIVTKSVSRFARNTETVLKFSRELKNNGIGIFFELQNINTLSGEGELMLTVLAAFAQAESEGMSENAKLMFRRRFSQGKAINPMNWTYGYTCNEKGETLIDEEQAEVIRLMFDLAEKGIWVGKIKTYLQKHNFKTGNGCEWIDAAVYRVLRNPDYTGDRTLQKSYQDAMRIRHKNKGQVPKWIITNDHPAIVSKEQWERVQTVLDKRSEELKDKTPINTDKPNSRSTYPLSGKMFCPYCGKVLMHRYENGRRREMWVCRTFQKVHPRTCRGIRVPNAVASEWGELTEPVTVIESNDEYGMQHFTAYPKAEYEASAECPYDPTPVEKPKKVKIEKAKKPRGGQQIRPHRQKPEVREDSHSKYALSGKLYCPYCSKVLTHKWDDLIEYWVCSTNRNLHRKFSDGIRCKGFYFPAELAIPWGEVNEKLTVVAYTDDNGKKQYTAYPKDEYERMKACTTIENRKDGKTYGKEDNTDSTETEK